MQLTATLAVIADVMLAGLIMIMIDVLSKPATRAQLNRQWQRSILCAWWSVLYASASTYIARYHTTGAHRLCIA